MNYLKKKKLVLLIYKEYVRYNYWIIFIFINKVIIIFFKLLLLFCLFLFREICFK